MRPTRSQSDEGDAASRDHRRHQHGWVRTQSHGTPPPPEALADVFPVSHWQQDMAHRPDFRGREQRCKNTESFRLQRHIVFISQQDTVKQKYRYLYFDIPYGLISLSLFNFTRPFFKGTSHFLLLFVPFRFLFYTEINSVLNYANTCIHLVPQFNAYLNEYNKTHNIRDFIPGTSWPLQMGPLRCPETSVKDCHSTLRNIPEERRSQNTQQYF